MLYNALWQSFESSLTLYEQCLPVHCHLNEPKRITNKMVLFENKNANTLYAFQFAGTVPLKESFTAMRTPSCPYKLVCSHQRYLLA